MVLYDINFRYLGQDDSQANLGEGKYTDIKRGDTVFEVGAYTGFHAIRLSQIVGKSGHVTAIEAVPSNFEILKKNIEGNNIENITALNYAIWNQKGSIAFNVDERQKNSAVENVIDKKKQIEIPSQTIDNLIESLNVKKLDFIRIQTNGAELEALQGMANTFKLKPKILVAVPYINKEKIQRMLDDLGYKTTFTGHSILAE